MAVVPAGCIGFSAVNSCLRCFCANENTKSECCLMVSACCTVVYMALAPFPFPRFIFQAGAYATLHLAKIGDKPPYLEPSKKGSRNVDYTRQLRR